jgi:hypothetical protein
VPIAVTAAPKQIEWAISRISKETGIRAKKKEEEKKNHIPIHITAFLFRFYKLIMHSPKAGHHAGRSPKLVGKSHSFPLSALKLYIPPLINPTAGFLSRLEMSKLMDGRLALSEEGECWR